jgi:hypothetical protein
MTRRHAVRGALVMASATTALLCACAADSTSSDEVPAVDPDATTPTPTQAPDATSDVVIELPRGRSSSALPQGRYAVRLTSRLAYQVDVPDRWNVVGGRFLNADPQASIFFVAPAPSSTGLPLHPCRDHTIEVVGPTVSDLAAAVRRQPVLDVTRPVPVTLAGYRGLYVEVTIPETVESGSCVDERVSLFESGGPDGYAWQGGYVGRWWILDVEGERMVVMPQCDTGCSEDEFATLTTMAESITFTQDE